MNKKTLNLSLMQGSLINDPKLYYTKEGNPICTFDIAVPFKIKSSDNVTEDIGFVTIQTRDKVAEACSKYLKKDMEIRARGRLKQDTWTAKDGTPRQKVYVEASTVEFLNKGETK